MGVALRAEADDRDGLAVEEGQVCVVVIEHGRVMLRDPGSPAAPAAQRERRSTDAE